jgi:hypothetical protein
MARVVKFLDKFVFLKKGYSVLAHVLPIGVASLLLLTLSVPKDNLLLKLVQALERPGWVWLPAWLLTIVSAYVYFISIKVQVLRGYLFSSGIMLRSAGTSLFFILLCTLMAIAVLISASPGAITPPGIWACFLLAALSLTGIGWSTPTTWIEALGIKPPDYREAQRLLRQLSATLRSVRAKPRAQRGDITKFLDDARKLFSELEKNLEQEPQWAQPDIRRAKDSVSNLIERVEARFPADNNQAIEDFAPVLNCKKEFQYADVIGALRAVAQHWPEWQCPTQGGI